MKTCISFLTSTAALVLLAGWFLIELVRVLVLGDKATVQPEEDV